MDFSKKAPTARKNIVIGDKLIVVGDDAWQIHNLTRISRGESRIVLDVPEPTFTEKEPSGSVDLTSFLIWSVIGLGVAIFFDNAIPIWIGMIIGIYNLGISKSSKKIMWARRKREFEKKRAVWRQLKYNPPIVYSLAIETNAGSRPVFYSFDKEGIERIVKAVKNEMVNPEARAMTYNIDAINLSGDMTVNNVGSTILKQTYKEIKRDNQ